MQFVFQLLTRWRIMGSSAMCDCAQWGGECHVCVAAASTPEFDEEGEFVPPESRSGFVSSSVSDDESTPTASEDEVENDDACDDESPDPEQTIDDCAPTQVSPHLLCYEDFSEIAAEWEREYASEHAAYVVNTQWNAAPHARKLHPILGCDEPSFTIDEIFA